MHVREHLLRKTAPITTLKKREARELVDGELSTPSPGSTPEKTTDGESEVNTSPTSFLKIKDVPPKTRKLSELENGETGVTLEDFLRRERPSWCYKAELLDGEVLLQHMPTLKHSDFQTLLLVWLVKYAELKSQRYKINVDASMKPNANKAKLYEPDLLMYDKTLVPNHEHLKGSFPGAPHLTVEVSCTTADNDLIKKKAAYFAAGVRNYIVVDLQHEPNDIYYFVHQGGEDYVEISPGPDGCFRTETFPGLVLHKNGVLANDLVRVVEALEYANSTFFGRLFAWKGREREDVEKTQDRARAEVEKAHRLAREEVEKERKHRRTAEKKAKQEIRYLKQENEALQAKNRKMEAVIAELPPAAKDAVEALLRDMK